MCSLAVLLGFVAVASAGKCWVDTEDKYRQPATKAPDSKFNLVKLAAIPPQDPTLGPETLASNAGVIELLSSGI